MSESDPRGWTGELTRLPPTVDLRRVSADHLLVGLYTRRLQGLLAAAAVAHGYGSYAPGPIDGIGGLKTRSALVRFQQAAGLVPDAICGPKTWARLLGQPGQ